MSLLRAPHDHQSVMANPSYKLRTTLFGHTSDVRAVATFADGTIVSTSRDETARIWKPSGNGKDYEHTTTLRGHTNFVTSVCIINPSEQNPTGLIITGSHDKTIRIYVPDQTEPINIIKSHEGTVCKLKTGTREGTFLSSSWDMSAKLWDLNDLSKPQLNLLGHQGAVWCVADLSSGSIVTGSADKFVIIWTSDGSVQHKLNGHTDCVRDISAINSDEFFTCANDATICRWSASLGTCIGTYCGHENYIYSILALENGKTIYSCGEDRTLRIWDNAELSQTITLPTQSVWCLALLPDGDIITGSSDAVVRIFSREPERYADPETVQEFEQEAARSKLNAQLELGGIKTKDLPDTKALLQPGQRDGQTKIVNDGDAVIAYIWSQKEQRWNKVGTVMGASGGSAATSGKQLYNGIEYDYVFSVDIQDGIPPLKLPYNNDQDPWQAAQKFLHDNGLSQLFLEQVANFIIKNSQSAPVLKTDAQYADPLTGGSRYIPQSSANTAAHETAKPAMPITSDTSVPSYIPHTKYLKLEQANTSQILEKLRELNAKQTETLKVSNDKLESLMKLTGNQASEQLKSDGLGTLKMLFNWPDDVLFPVLDIARLAVLRKDLNDALCTEELLQIVKRHIKSDAFPFNQMLTFRLLANMFSHERGEKLSLNYKDEILKLLLDLGSLANKNNQVAISTYILNLTVALNKYNDTSGKTQCLNAIFSILPRLNESEAVFRALVALGTLLSTSNSENRNDLINAVRQSEVALNILHTMSETTVSANKLANCSKQIISLII